MAAAQGALRVSGIAATRARCRERGPSRLTATFVLLAFASPAVAQTSRIASDVVAAADGDAGSEVERKPTAWLDLFGAIRVTDALDVRARPVVFRRSFDGEWRAQMYELALRYERPGNVGWRADVGQFTSPVGLRLLEDRPGRNPAGAPPAAVLPPAP